MVTAMEKRIMGAGVRTPISPCSQAGLGQVRSEHSGRKGSTFLNLGWWVREIEASGPSQGGASVSVSPQLFGGWAS